MTDIDGLVDDLADDELVARLGQRGHPNPLQAVARRDTDDGRALIAAWLGATAR